MTFSILSLSPLFGADTASFLAITAVLAAFIVFGTLILFSARYKRCPSNKIMVIFGRSASKSSALCIHGGAKFIVPLFQDYAFLSLEPMQIEIPLRGALSMENIRVNVPSVFSIAIGTTPELMQNAAIRLLGMPKQAIAKQAEDVIFGQLRQVIASMKIDEINRDREAFLTNIQASLEPELRKLGLVLINVNVTDITDESGYIEAIGQKAASEAIQKARGDVADNERMGETRVADAEKDKAIQVANAKKEQAIGTREAVSYISTSGDFYYVNYQGIYGYVLKDFFSTDINAPINYGDGGVDTPSTGSGILYCCASEAATLRSIASRSGDALASVASRQAVEYLSTVGEFYQVRYNGQIGYVLAVYFSADPNAPLNYGTN